eukprot:COSAG02_NODE_27131_length_616_cov_1.139265_1_plen_60_part_00
MRMTWVVAGMVSDDGALFRQVITHSQSVDWLKDRWQAAKDMNGTPIPGKHWAVRAAPVY